MHDQYREGVYIRLKCLHRISHFNPIGRRDCAESCFTGRMSQKTDPFLQYYSAPLEFTFWDRAEKNLLDRAIFILKMSHRKWEQKVNSLNMKSISERNRYLLFLIVCHLKIQ